MNCPNCGAELTQGMNFCQSCGAPVQQAPDQQYAQQYDQQYAQQYAQQYDQQYAQQYDQQYAQQYDQQYAQQYQQPFVPKNLKEFIKAGLCSPDIPKQIKSSWIILFIVAGISIVVAILGKTLPLDGLLIAAIAVWLLTTNSVAAGVTAGVVGILEMILTSIALESFGGWLPAIGGVYAMIATLKANKQFKAYLTSIGVQ